MDKLERKIPPVALFVILLVINHQIANELIAFQLLLPFHNIVFSLSILLAGFVGLAGVYEFKKAKTTVNPVQVEKASTVVDSGVFAYTRNPMYLGLLLLLLGFAYWQQNILALMVSFLFVPYMNRFQIIPEERALEKLFGVEYLEYQLKVRRWI